MGLVWGQVLYCYCHLSLRSLTIIFVLLSSLLSSFDIVIEAMSMTV